MAPIEMPAVQPGEDRLGSGLRTGLLDRPPRAAAKRSIQRADGRKSNDVSTQPVGDSQPTSSHMSTLVTVPVDQLAQRIAVDIPPTILQPLGSGQMRSP
jgi:hypothetical protein